MLRVPGEDHQHRIDHHALHNNPENCNGYLPVMSVKMATVIGPEKSRSVVDANFVKKITLTLCVQNVRSDFALSKTETVSMVFISKIRVAKC